ncbi:prolactin-2B1-like [Arvicola amphibius]|uniref:prolactin-2B1-like n=1 Tax=Arvicola amphibius TaxID=1047088 RepID=UPI0018E31961|nr:prolactin-2B1-like [Arvicola amphibius]
MPLSLTQVFSSKALLLLLVSYLLLWENVTSAPTCVKRDGDTQKSLRRLFTMATFISQITSRQAANLFTEFDKQYAQGKRYNDRIPDSCPTDFLDTPENKNQVLKSSPEDLLKLLCNLLYSWTVPLNHLVKEMSSMPGAPNGILSEARAIQERVGQLMVGVKTILSEIGEKNDEIYLVWSGLASLKSSNEDVRCFAFYNLIRCLLRDSHRVNTFLEVLKYRIIQDKC